MTIHADLPAALEALAARLAATEPANVVDHLRVAAHHLRRLAAAGRLPHDTQEDTDR